MQMKVNRELISTASVSPTQKRIINIEISEDLAKGISSASAANDIAIQALTNALATGIAEMTKEGNVQLDELEDGNINSKEFVVKVFHRGASSALKSGAKTTAALTIRKTAEVVGRRLGLDIAKRIGRHTFTAIAFGIVDQGTDTYLYFSGQLKERDYKVNTTQNVGSVSGAALGAVVGSAVPGAGTAFGSMLGGMLGSYWGAVLGKSVGEDFFGKGDEEQILEDDKYSENNPE